MIEAIPDPHRAYQRAAQLAAVLRDAAENVADLRTRNAAQLQVVEGLSLAALGRRLGVSKARAEELVRRATTARGRR